MSNYDIDVHGLSRIEARKHIIDTIKDYYNKKKTLLYVNHGFNNGNKIKTWLLEGNDIKSLDEVIDVKENPCNPGITIIHIKLK